MEGRPGVDKPYGWATAFAQERKDENSKQFSRKPFLLKSNFWRLSEIPPIFAKAYNFHSEQTSESLMIVGRIF